MGAVIRVGRTAALATLVACGPKHTAPIGPPIAPPPPPDTARFCADGMDLHATLVLAASRTGGDLVLAGPTQRVQLPDGPLGPAIDRAAIQAGLVASEHDGARLLAPVAVRPGPAPAGMDAPTIGFALDRVPWVALAQILSQEGGRPVRLEGVPETTVSLVMRATTPGRALALTAAASGLELHDTGDAVVLRPGAAGAAGTPAPRGSGPWTLAAVVEGPHGAAWFQGPDGTARSIRLGELSPTLDVGRLRGIEGDAIHLQTDAGEDRSVRLCETVPRGTTAWATTTVSQALGDTPLLWPPVRGPLGGDPERVITLAWLDAGPRAEAIVEPGTRPGAPPDPVRIALPWAVEVLHGLVRADVDADGGDELIVLADWVTGVGPTGVVPFGGAVVLDTVGKRVEATVNDALGEARTAADVARILGVAAEAVPGAPIGRVAGH
jgi:hypothetical protein